MQVSHSSEINDSSEKLWDTLRSFGGVERYLPIVSKTIVEGTGQGAKRICDVQMGSQIFQIQETLEVLMIQIIPLLYPWMTVQFR